MFRQKQLKKQKLDLISELEKTAKVEKLVTVKVSRLPEMKKKLLILITVIFYVSSQTSLAQNDGKLVAQEIYQFPTYPVAVEKTDVEKYTSKKDYDQAVADKRFELSKLSYLSDGLKVKAYLYKPKKLKTKLPVIIFNRGSFIRGDIAPELVVFFHRLALEGFVILAPMYRQSDGDEGRDEMGGGDLHDLMNVVPLIKSLDFADTKNLFIYGESRGGIMTYLALRQQFPANAASVFGAVTNMEAYLSDNVKAFTPKALNQIWTDFEKNKPQILTSRSAINWANEINIPTLIMQGGSDAQVNPLQSLSISEKLQSLGKTYQLKIFAGDNHILNKNQIERDRETVAWFRSYLKK